MKGKGPIGRGKRRSWFQVISDKFRFWFHFWRVYLGLNKGSLKDCHGFACLLALERMEKRFMLSEDEWQKIFIQIYHEKQNTVVNRLITQRFVGCLGSLSLQELDEIKIALTGYYQKLSQAANETHAEWFPLLRQFLMTLNNVTQLMNLKASHSERSLKEVMGSFLEK